MFLKLYTLFHLKNLSNDRGSNYGRKKENWHVHTYMYGNPHAIYGYRETVQMT